MNNLILNSLSARAPLLPGFVLLVSITGSVVGAQNWPQWRGPVHAGVAPDATPPVTWSETNNVKWKVEVPGDGSSTPLVWGDRIFVQTAVPTGKKAEPAPGASEAPPATNAAAVAASQGGDGRPDSGRGPGGRRGGFGRGFKPTEYYQFVVMCLDRATGKTIWSQVAREEVPHEGVFLGEGTFAASSGVTDGQHLWAFFGSRGLYCYDLDGKLKWSKDLGDMRVSNGFGEGSSPALYRDSLFVNWDHEDGSFIVALDKSTGKEIWKQTRDERTSWSTPLVIERDGKTQVIVAATGKIRSYDAATGKVIWECGGLTRNVIPTPVADQDLVYCMSGFQGNALLAIKPGSGDLTDTDSIVWSHKKSTSYVPSALLYNGRLWFFAANNAVLTSLEAKSGKILIDAERLEGMQGIYASPLGAAGRIYLASRNGTTLVLKDSEKFEFLATNRLEDKFDASPVAVGKDLLLRGRKNLYCLAEK